MSTDRVVAYLGSEGSYSHQASQQAFPEATHRGVPRFQEVFEAVQSDAADYALVPVENTLGGRVEDPYRLLEGMKLLITGELILPIHHCLVIPFNSIEGVPPENLNATQRCEWKRQLMSAEQVASVLSQIREVYSHPQGLRQCRNYLKQKMPDAAQRDASDTASAAKMLAQRTDYHAAAITSKIAANIYDMIILEENIEDDHDNGTRFLVLTKGTLEPSEPVSPAVTTILFQLKHQPGSLVAALKAFSDNGINLTKLETYMANRERGNPTFYVDVGEHYFSERMKAAMRMFAEHVDRYEIKGTYKASPQRGLIGGFLKI